MAESTEVGELAAATLKSWLDRGEPLVVLDVRENHERDYARIALPPGVADLHIPLGQIPARVDEVEDQARRHSLVIYCHHGQRSMVAATWLARQGVGNIHNLDGGIDAWSILVDRAVPRY